MKKAGTFVIIITVILLSGTVVWSSTFKDISEKHWAYNALEELYNKGIVKGFPKSTMFKGERFAPSIKDGSVLDATSWPGMDEMAMATPWPRGSTSSPPMSRGWSYALGKR